MEYFIAPLLNSKFIKYVSFVIAFLFAWAYKLDILGSMFEMFASVPFFGYVVTALIVSRGANFVHDFFTVIEQKKITKSSK